MRFHFTNFWLGLNCQVTVYYNNKWCLKYVLWATPAIPLILSVRWDLLCWTKKSRHSVYSKLKIFHWRKPYLRICLDDLAISDAPVAQSGFLLEERGLLSAWLRGDQFEVTLPKSRSSVILGQALHHPGGNILPFGTVMRFHLEENVSLNMSFICRPSKGKPFLGGIALFCSKVLDDGCNF